MFKYYKNLLTCFLINSFSVEWAWDHTSTQEEPELKTQELIEKYKENGLDSRELDIITVEMVKEKDSITEATKSELKESVFKLVKEQFASKTWIFEWVSSGHYGIDFDEEDTFWDHDAISNNSAARLMNTFNISQEDMLNVLNNGKTVNEQEVEETEVIDTDTNYVELQDSNVTEAEAKPLDFMSYNQQEEQVEPTENIVPYETLEAKQQAEQQELTKVTQLTKEYNDIQIPELLEWAEFDGEYIAIDLTGKNSSEIQSEIANKLAFVEQIKSVNNTYELEQQELTKVTELTQEYNDIQIPQLLEWAEFDWEYIETDLEGKNSSEIQAEIEKKQAFVKEIEAANDTFNIAQQQETERYDSVITTIKEYRTLVRNSNKLYPEVKSQAALADAMKPLIAKDNQASSEQIEAANLAMKEYKQEVKELETIRKARVQWLSKRYREGWDKYSELEEQFNKDIQKKGKTTLEEMNTFEEAMNQIDNKSDSIDSTESDKSFIDSTTDKIMSIYDKSIEFVDGKKIGSFTGENGEEVEIQYDSESKTLSIDTAFFDWVTDYDINRCFAEVDMSSRESAEETIWQHIAELQAEYNAKVKQYKESWARFWEVWEAMEKWWDATTEFVWETYEKVSKAIKEFLWEHPDLGTVTLDDGTELNIEFNETDNTFFVDTEFFDGVSDYNSTKIELSQNEIDNIIDLLNWENSEETEKRLSDLVEWKSKELKAEYQEKIEANEAEKRNKRIKEVFAGNKKFTNVGEVTIWEETMDVRLVRRGLNDMKIKLNTPFGDGISDSEVTIDFAKTKDSFKNMGEVEKLINEKTKELVSKYENLLKENNNKNSEEEIQVDVKNEAVVDNDWVNQNENEVEKTQWDVIAETLSETITAEDLEGLDLSFNKGDISDQEITLDNDKYNVKLMEISQSDITGVNKSAAQAKLRVSFGDAEMSTAPKIVEKDGKYYMYLVYKNSWAQIRK